MKIFKYIQEALDAKLPFVAYRKPNANLLQGIFQQDAVLHTVRQYTESGFIFAPFDAENPSVLIPIKRSKQFEEEIEKVEINLNKKKFLAAVSSKEKHIKLVGKGIEAIEENQFKKVVLSREEKVDLENFEGIEAFQKLLHFYTNAFVYIWYHPTIGLWLGASPETLLKVNKYKFTTMSLAGTQLYGKTGEVHWSDKELEEQQFVTNYIVEKLAAVCATVQKSNTETVKAGKLAHLKTRIYGEFDTQKASLKNLIQTLHPTPAVCGLPKEIAKKFILKNEQYHRSFYTGFLGELNMRDSELYVNLRCMQIKKDCAHLYIGGGITKASNPVLEWEETVSKSETMKRVL